MTCSNAAVEALQNRHILQLMCHYAEQEIIFIDPLHIKLRLRPFQRTVQHNVVCCAQFQIRQILCCCVFLFSLVVFDSAFLLLFIVFFCLDCFFQSLWLILKACQGSISSLWIVIVMCFYGIQGIIAVISVQATIIHWADSYSFWQCNKLCCIRFSHRTVKTMETVQREWQLWQCNYFQQEKEMKHNEGATICKKCLDPQCY